MENEYESMLGEAYKNIKPTEYCDRFEIKKAEGHHEGNKTIVTNFLQISTCLRRIPEHVSKFLFKELATPGEIAGERLILTRKLNSVQINEKLGKYVEIFVKCGKCGKPDTEIVPEKEKTYLKCMACGTKREIHQL